MMKYLLIALIGLFLVQVVLTIPLTFRLVVETVNNIDLRLSFGIRIPFDWHYVKTGLND